MTDQPTPETDAMFTDNVPEDAQIVAFCERLERERNALRADVARLRTALEGIAEYGVLSSDGSTRCARLIYLAKQALNTPAQ